MSYFAITPSLIASGSINTASFVKGDPSNDHACLQAGAGDTAIGVSSPATNYPPGVPGATTVAASAGQGVTVYGPGSIVEVQVGASSISRGFVKPDASGYATTANPGDIATAYSFEAAAAGTFTRMLVLAPVLATAGSSGLVVSASANTTLTAADNAKTIVVTAADRTITVPTGVTGMRFTVIATGTGATGGSTGTTVHVPTGDTLGGNGFTAASGKGAVNTHGTAVDGDWIEILCVAANTWYVRGIKGTWAREA